MPVELVAVNSNVDRLSEESVHHLFEDLVYRSVHEGEDWMRLVVPKGQRLGLERNIGVHGPTDEGVEITASVGIPPILERDVSRADSYFPGEQNAGDYPLFVDRGTGMFGPAHAPIVARRGVMAWDSADGNTIFRRTTQGQPARHFMLDTYEQITRVALPLEQARFAARVKNLYADPNPTL